MTSLRPSDLARAEQALGWRPTDWRRAAPERATGANAEHWIVGDGHRTAFLKIAAAPLVAGWLRTEHRNLAALAGPFAPAVLGFADDPERPVLALEDLSDAEWPPPWSSTRVDAVLASLREVASTQPPAHLRALEVDPAERWTAVAADPAPFLSVGLCSRRWLDANLYRLVLAAADAPLGGDALVHLDVRSDNLCFRDGRAILLDWNHATIANADLDVAFWLPSLHAEGGPPPEAVLPDAPELAAWVAGFFCSYAGLPPIPDAPHVRPLQVAQARTALRWAARALGLPPPMPG